MIDAATRLREALNGIDDLQLAVDARELLPGVLDALDAAEKEIERLKESLRAVVEAAAWKPGEPMYPLVQRIEALEQKAHGANP